MKRQQLPDFKSAFPEWYNEVIFQAELVDQSPVRGAMVVMPYGCAMWEAIVKVMDERIKATGHSNALFPLFIPESFLKKEADHVEGFAPELAVVTHAGGHELEEPLIVRPTSETIIHYMFARWIKSWRDLPLKINQWANVVRWEMRPRPFLRTTEFYWQEGHTAHATRDEAYAHVKLMLDEYVSFCRNYLAIPVIAGRKTDQEKFPGAEITLTFEGIMPDGKALQMGTSHLLSQSFAHAFDMEFQTQEGTLAYPYLTSWGTTTRLVGAMVMVHGDQKGLVLPPKIAPIQVVIIPIIKSGVDSVDLMNAINTLESQLKTKGIRVFVDNDTQKSPGFKFNHWELKGVPLRFEIGVRDFDSGVVTVVSRISEKKQYSLNDIVSLTPVLLDEIQSQLLLRAEQHVQSIIQEIAVIDSAELFEKNGIAYKTSWCVDKACETRLKDYKASIRCILEHEPVLYNTCFGCNKESVYKVIVARSY